jgi:hypothetical protein
MMASNAVMSEGYVCTGCSGVLTLWNDDGPMDRLQVKSNIEPWTPDIFLLGPLDAAGNFKVRLSSSTTKVTALSSRWSMGVLCQSMQKFPGPAQDSGACVLAAWHMRLPSPSAEANPELLR